MYFLKEVFVFVVNKGHTFPKIKQLVFPRQILDKYINISWNIIYCRKDRYI